MGAQNGKDFLIKVDMSGAGQFVTLAGLRVPAENLLVVGKRQAVIRALFPCFSRHLPRRHWPSTQAFSVSGQ